MTWVGWLVAGFVATFVGREVRRRLRRRAIREVAFPVGLRAKLAHAHPRYDAAQVDAILEGLRDWFEIAHAAKRRFVSMPSQAVDTAWHEFILFTRSYDDYCRRTLGRFLHHVPAEAMRSQTKAQEGIRRTWRLACAREGIDPNKPQRLPRIFALDAALAFPGGFVYALDCAGAGKNANGDPYCASHIGCASGCGGGSDGSSDASDGGSDGGGGCGGGD